MPAHKSLDSRAAAKLIGVTESELGDLCNSDVIEKNKGGKYPLDRLVRGYLDHVKSQSSTARFPTQKVGAERIDMSERNYRDVCINLGIDHRTTPIDDIVIRYIRDIREKAAGRGGDEQASLTLRRAEESEVNTAINRLKYHELLDTLIAADDAATAITDWCSYANREYLSGFVKLIGTIQTEYKIKIGKELVEKIARPTIDRIKNHAENIGGDLVKSARDVSAAGNDPDGEMD